MREGDGTAIRVMKKLGIDPKDLRVIIENKIVRKEIHSKIEKDNIEFKRNTERNLKNLL